MTGPGEERLARGPWIDCAEPALEEAHTGFEPVLPENRAVEPGLRQDGGQHAGSELKPHLTGEASKALERLNAD